MGTRVFYRWPVDDGENTLDTSAGRSAGDHREEVIIGEGFGTSRQGEDERAIAGGFLGTHDKDCDHILEGSAPSEGRDDGIAFMEGRVSDDAEGVLWGEQPMRPGHGYDF